MTRFIKLDIKDRALPATAEDFAAVLDTQTNLIWGKTLPKRLTDAQADAAATKQKKGWRVPEQLELESLRDLTRFNPAIDTQFFPDTKSDWYRSRTPFVADSGSSWAVSFDYGGSDFIHHDDDAFVRLVRSAPAGAGQ